MTFLLNQVFQFFRLLNSEKGTNQIAAGIACGLILGLTPVFSLQTLLVVFLLFFFRIQIGAALLSATFFAIPAWLMDPLFDRIGGFFLEIPSLKPTWTELYHAPIIPLTRFNNSIVMGSGVVALALVVPMFFLAKKLVGTYREKVVAKFETTRFWKALTATRFYKWYLKYEDLKG